MLTLQKIFPGLQARNQLVETPRQAKSFLRVATIFRLCPAHFSREGEKFCPTGYGGLLLCMRFFGFHRTNNFSSFVVCFNVVQLILFWQNNKVFRISDCVKIFHEAKLQAFVKMQITRNQQKTFQNRRIFRELNNSTLAELPSKLTGQTLVLFIASWITTHLVCLQYLSVYFSLNWHY